MSETKLDIDCKIRDSGDRTLFASGAVRDMREGKGRCDLLPLDVISDYFYYMSRGEAKTQEFKLQRVFGHISNFMDEGEVDNLFRAINAAEPFCNIYDMLLEVAKHFEEGAKKYGDDNWRKGIPVRCYIDSAVRHYLKYLRGDKDEPHDRAFCWNILCAIWTCKHRPELNDYAKYSTEDCTDETTTRSFENECVVCGLPIPEGETYCYRCKKEKGIE